MRKWITASIALLLTLAAVLFPFPGRAAAAQKDQQLYKKASDAYERLKKDAKKRRYRDQWERVISDFDAVAKRYPSSHYAGYALFKKAEAVQSMHRVSRTRDDLRAAARAYDDFVERYPDNENVAEGLYRSGTIYLELGDKAKAADSYRALVERFPGSAYSSSAKASLRSLPGGPSTGPVAAVVPDGEPAMTARPTGTGRFVTLKKVDRPARELSRVSDIRHWSNTDTTRVVIELEGGFEYEGHLIKAPDRLFFDIKGASIPARFKEVPIDINDGILKSVRTSQYDGETVRVVLDLDSVGDYKTLMLPDPPRLVVDVFSAAAGESRICPKPDTGAAPGSQAAAAQQPAPAGSGTLSIARQMGLCVKTIVLDPGHGGKDSGAVGRRGLKEKDVVLDIARRLREIIENKLDCRVIMTRDKDVFIELDARPVVARSNNADLFISIHANASRNRSARGVETYLLNLTKDRGIMEVAARENATTEKNMSDINSILFDLVLDNKRDESLDLAHKVQENLVKDLKVSDKGVKQGPFLVLYGAAVPSILTEVGFISNPEEERLLQSVEYRQNIAEAIFNGIKDYISSGKAATYSASR